MLSLPTLEPPRQDSPVSTSPRGPGSWQVLHFCLSWAGVCAQSGCLHFWLQAPLPQPIVTLGQFQSHPTQDTTLEGATVCLPHFPGSTVAQKELSQGSPQVKNPHCLTTLFVEEARMRISYAGHM